MLKQFLKKITSLKCNKKFIKISNSYIIVRLKFRDFGIWDPEVDTNISFDSCEYDSLYFKQIQFTTLILKEKYNIIKFTFTLILKCFIENHKNLIFNSHSLCRNRKTKKNWVINITPYRLNYKKKNSMHMCKYIRVNEKTDILSMEIDYLHVKKLTRVTKTFLRKSKSLLNGIHLKFYFSTN